jgi:glycosyltransferase involved in cell wall biosynthesis
LRIVIQGVFQVHESQILEKLLRHIIKQQVSTELTVISEKNGVEKSLNILTEIVKPGMFRTFDSLPQNEMLTLLEKSDVFLLISAFDGMENSLVEAMGRGCIPIVMQTDQLANICNNMICDGDNGFTVPAGDIESIAKRIKLLQHDIGLRQKMLFDAYDTAFYGNYSTVEMCRDYIEVFKHALDVLNRGTFKRLKGGLQHPPPMIDGVSIFPANLLYEKKNIGRFPELKDYEQFKQTK